MSLHHLLRQQSLGQWETMMRWANSYWVNQYTTSPKTSGSAESLLHPCNHPHQQFPPWFRHQNSQQWPRCHLMCPLGTIWAATSHSHFYKAASMWQCGPVGRLRRSTWTSDPGTSPASLIGCPVLIPSFHAQLWPRHQWCHCLRHVADSPAAKRAAEAPLWEVKSRPQLFLRWKAGSGCGVCKQLVYVFR